MMPRPEPFFKHGRSDVTHCGQSIYKILLGKSGQFEHITTLPHCHVANSCLTEQAAD